MTVEVLGGEDGHVAEAWQAPALLSALADVEGTTVPFTLLRFACVGPLCT